ncbi:MAG: PKD domain-containing protein [Methanospirillum sp.]|nr:PKD domain-containing protein [Methanospirillum sp.]
MTGIQASAISANARISPAQGTAPLMVRFSDMSEGSPVEWHWDFGDGHTGDGPQTMHTYLSPGSYSVKLLVLDAAGNSDSILLDQVIMVSANPLMPSIPVTIPSFSADFTGGPQSGFLPLEVHFSDLSKGEPSQWNWDFGDGSISHEKNPIHTYQHPGTYSVVLKISRDTSSAMKERKNYVTVSEDNPPARVTAEPTTPDVAMAYQGGKSVPVTPRQDNETSARLTTQDVGCEDLFMESDPGMISPGEPFIVAISGTPFEKVLVWISRVPDSPMTGRATGPVISDTDMLSDPQSGPYTIGSSIPDSSTGRTILDLIPENKSEHHIRYYGIIALDNTGKREVSFTSDPGSEGNYSVHSVSGDNLDLPVCISQTGITILSPAGG